jgi:hypothetical protein
VTPDRTPTILEGLAVSLTRLLCKHSFPLRPPHSLFEPGDCTGCGITFADRMREHDAAVAARRAATAHRGYCPGCNRPDQMLFLFIRQEQPWDLDTDETEEAKRTVYLCAHCWSDTTEAEESAAMSNEFFTVSHLRTRIEQHAHARQNPAKAPSTTHAPGPQPHNEPADAGADSSWTQPPIAA